jgi:RNA polymerase sigma-70 factor, ECF subfamily
MLDRKKCEDKKDEELVVLTLKDQDYYYCVVDRYEKKLLRYIMRISSATQEDAEDILQEVFIKVYKNLNNFDTSLKFSSWIYRITHNQTISHHRKSKARPQTIDSDKNEIILEMIKSDDDTVKKIDNDILRKNIDKALTKIGIKYKEALVLRFFEEKDYNEISDILQKPLGTVATLINRAKKKLKEELINN